MTWKQAFLRQALSDWETALSSITGRLLLQSKGLLFH